MDEGGGGRRDGVDLGAGSRARVTEFSEPPPPGAEDIAVGTGVPGAPGLQLGPLTPRGSVLSEMPGPLFRFYSEFQDSGHRALSKRGDLPSVGPS